MEGLFICQCEEETKALAKQFSKQLSLGDIVAFQGDLGSGKTTFIKALISSLSLVKEEEITSPTFNYVQSYPYNTSHLHHFDLYRLEDSEAFLAMGFLEYFSYTDISLIEWSEKIVSLLPKEIYVIQITTADKASRKIEITYKKRRI